ncbi:hypothetical protein FO519_007216 [Halicephalobus sp. NKZ332]|nr:hypothetical protein FO519_007216 [Halicephalobus sp. NKZ332]
MRIKSDTYNIIQLGIAFLFITFAFNSQGFIQQTIINEKNTAGVVSKHAGYISSSIIYGVFTVCNFFAAPIVEMLGPKVSMVISACFYALFECGFLFLNEPFLYISSALVGVAASLISTAQGKYMAMNSTKETATLHSGVFLGIAQTCITGGGIFLYFAFRNLKKDDIISDSTIRLVYGICIVVTVMGGIVLLLLRNSSTNLQSSTENNPHAARTMTFVQRMKSTYRLLMTKRMIFLAISFAYTGIGLSFWTGIYPTSISFTERLASNTKTILAFNAMAQGLGQMTAGFLFGIVHEITRRFGRTRIVFLGLAVHLISYVAIYLNFPSDAPLDKTEDEGVIKPPSPVIAVVCGYLLGFGDACWHTQICALLISMYNKRSAEAFSLYKLFQSLTTATSYLYATKFKMELHMLVLVVTGIFGFAGFLLGERLPITAEEEQYKADSTDDKDQHKIASVVEEEQ